MCVCACFFLSYIPASFYPLSALLMCAIIATPSQWSQLGIASRSGRGQFTLLALFSFSSQHKQGGLVGQGGLCRHLTGLFNNNNNNNKSPKGLGQINMPFSASGPITLPCHCACVRLSPFLCLCVCAFKLEIAKSA